MDGNNLTAEMNTAASTQLPPPERCHAIVSIFLTDLREASKQGALKVSETIETFKQKYNVPDRVTDNLKNALITAMVDDNKLSQKELMTAFDNAALRLYPKEIPAQLQFISVSSSESASRIIWQMNMQSRDSNKKHPEKWEDFSGYTTGVALMIEHVQADLTLKAIPKSPGPTEKNNRLDGSSIAQSAFKPPI